ncbi:PKD domain, partial [Trinorchestia longiramus]
VPTFTFTDPTGADFPTDASVLINWNDGSDPEILAFNHTGNSIPVVTHNYTVNGFYTIDAFIYNMISGYNVSTNVTIVEQIHQFAITNGYY